MLGWLSIPPAIVSWADAQGEQLPEAASKGKAEAVAAAEGESKGESKADTKGEAKEAAEAALEAQPPAADGADGAEGAGTVMKLTAHLMEPLILALLEDSSAADTRALMLTLGPCFQPVRQCAQGGTNAQRAPAAPV